MHIRVVDDRGHFLGGTIDLDVTHRRRRQRTHFAHVDASKDIHIRGLRRWPARGYRVTVTPGGGLRPQSQFIRVPRNAPAALKFVFPVQRLLRAESRTYTVMIAATTNNPTEEIVRDLQGALRARYDPDDWREVVQPINDTMRGLQRDALVAFILHRMRIAADIERDKAQMSKRKSQHENRGVQWVRQFNRAALEIKEIGRKILTSLIAEQVARHELELVKTQIDNTSEVDELLHDRFTNEELYTWMQGEISRLYYEYYRFAFDTARKAERTMKQELMRPELDAQDFVKFNYWDGGRNGLLSGEALHLDLKRLEMAYYDNNKRELELTRDVSLRQLDPVALLTLKSTGSCQVTVPEWLYDRDCPGHFMRRIRTVALSVTPPPPPGTGVYCTLSLLGSSVRKSPIPKDGEYVRQGVEDDRFADYAGMIQSIVTSTPDHDSGMFDPTAPDNRFLPFEGSGAIST